MRGLAPLLALAALLPLGAASAQANLPTAIVLDVDAPLEELPVDRLTSFPYRVTLDVQAPSTGSVVVDLSSAAPETWSVYFDPPTHTIETGPLPGKHTVEGTVSVRPRGDTPALLATKIALTASTPGNELLAPATATVEPTFRAAWRPGLYVVVEDAAVVLPPRGGSESALAEAHNTGNGAIRVHPELVRAPEGCTVPLVPEEVRLAPDERAPLRLEVTCQDGWPSGSLVVRYVHVLALDPTREGVPVEPQWDVVKPDENGFGGPRSYGDGPRRYYESPWPVLAAPAGLAVAALLRRRLS